MKNLIIVSVMVLVIVIGREGYGQIATGIIWAADTVGNEQPDTLSRLNAVSIKTLLPKWNRTWSFTVWADSSIEVSDTIAFTPGRTLRIPAGVTYRSELLDAAVFRDLYIRKRFADGVAEYVVSARGF